MVSLDKDRAGETQKDYQKRLYEASFEFFLKYFLLLAFFFAGIYLATLVWYKIRLPFINPWNVVGVLALAQFNPANNFVRFFVFIASPIILLAVFYLVGARLLKDICFGKRREVRDLSPSSSSPRTTLIFSVLFVLFSVVIALNIVTYHSWGRFDAYHEGETMGPSVSWMNGKIPYKDFMLVHGIYEDPLRSVLAFKLFGRSIASVRILQSLHKLILFVLMAIFLLRIYNANLTTSFLTMLIIFPPAIPILCAIFPALYSGFLPPIILARDITTFSFLIVCTQFQRYVKGYYDGGRRFFLTAFAFSFIPFASFCYSVDRGFYLSATYLVMAPLLYICFFHRSGYRIHYLTGSVLGMGAAIVLWGALLQGHYKDFFQFTFLIMPKFKELYDGYVYPFDVPHYFRITALIALNTYWLAVKFLQTSYANNNKVIPSVRQFLQSYFIEASLALISLFFFRSALGRCDWEHVMYSVLPAYILTAYIVIKHYARSILQHKASGYVVIVLVAVTFSFLFSTLYGENLMIKNFPVGMDDAWFIPRNYVKTIAFLKENLKEDEEFFTLTSQASWYYFLDRPCPSRFPVIWQAEADFFKNEIISDLKHKNVKFILYRNSWSTRNQLDKIPDTVRLKVIFDYIKEDYVFFAKIDDNEIWMRKPR